ncbi:methyltransferase -containing domain protein [Collimonas pratensis]|uniref:Methyltransferase-containing domain protein n=1 Tax=Collimonas pratensis TaxID=279113 RepID=A0A127PZU4_9BURK|nr:methyltransferase -containing domain protein [Collimonas pratensis]
MGNTPGHINHWSTRGFIQLISKYFDVIEVKSPLPWTMLLCQPRR